MGMMKRVRDNKKNKKPPKPFGAVEVKTVDSDDWQRLNFMEAHVYNTLKTFYRGDGQVFKSPFAALMRRSRIKHGNTLKKAINGLEIREWIKVTRYAKHGRGRGLRVKPNEYGLTFKYDYKRY